MRDQAAHQRLGFLDLLPQARAQRRDCEPEPASRQDDVVVAFEDAAHLLQHAAEGDAQRLVGRSFQNQFGEDRVVGVVEDDVFFGGEVIEERARRDVGRGCDLLDCRLVVALLSNQAHGFALDRFPGLLFLAFAQPSSEWCDRVRHQTAATSALTESAGWALLTARAGRKSAMRIAPTTSSPAVATSTSLMP